MRRFGVSILCMFQLMVGRSQGFDLDLFAGISNYQGDLQPIFFTFQNASPGAAVILKYGFTSKLYARGGFTFGSVAASDAKNREDLRPRNLSFRSGIQEFTVGLEYRLLDPEKSKITPYAFIGAGLFRFNPYAFGNNYTGRVYLQPLGTEGQGLPEYPERTRYSLTQFCIPYGVGVKWQITCNLNAGLEFRQTKLFTDYLDDVSSTYADRAYLLAGNGQQAVDFAWRQDEFDGTPYPPAGMQRGNPKQLDWYYFAGITFGLRLTDCSTGAFSLGGLFNRNSSGKLQKSKVDCPKVW
jgi:opacity protein-like surface antigen